MSQQSESFRLPKIERCPGGSRLPFRKSLYSVWGNMLGRCCDPRNSSFPRYGGRGIRVWSQFADFNCFYRWSIMNGYKPGLQLDRRNNDSDYAPWNCHFVTPRQNSLNTRLTRRLSDGRPAWPVAQANGLSRDCFYGRLRRGWSPDEAATVPAGDRAWSVLLADGRPAWPVAEANGLSVKTFYGRLSRGWSPDEAATVLLGDRAMPVLLAGGRPAWPVAQANGLSRDCFDGRLSRGWSPDEAATVPAGDRAMPVLLADGRPAWPVAQANGLSRDFFYGRLRRGWSPDDAATIPKGGKRPVVPALDKGQSPSRRVVQGGKAQRPAVQGDSKGIDK